MLLLQHQAPPAAHATIPNTTTTTHPPHQQPAAASQSWDPGGTLHQVTNNTPGTNTPGRTLTGAAHLAACPDSSNRPPSPHALAELILHRAGCYWGVATAAGHLSACCGQMLQVRTASCCLASCSARLQHTNTFQGSTHTAKTCGPRPNGSAASARDCRTLRAGGTSGGTETVGTHAPRALSASLITHTTGIDDAQPHHRLPTPRHTPGAAWRRVLIHHGWQSTTAGQSQPQPQPLHIPTPWALHCYGLIASWQQHQRVLNMHSRGVADGDNPPTPETPTLSHPTPGVLWPRAVAGSSSHLTQA
jgi:hypothetical protein